MILSDENHVWCVCHIIHHILRTGQKLPAFADGTFKYIFLERHEAHETSLNEHNPDYWIEA